MSNVHVYLKKDGLEGKVIEVSHQFHIPCANNGKIRIREDEGRLFYEMDNETDYFPKELEGLVEEVSIRNRTTLIGPSRPVGLFTLKNGKAKAWYGHYAGEENRFLSITAKTLQSAIEIHDDYYSGKLIPDKDRDFSAPQITADEANVAVPAKRRWFGRRCAG